MILNGALHNNFVHVHFVQCAKYPLQVLLYCALRHISTTSCTLSIEPSIMFHPPLDFNAKSLIRNRQRLGLTLLEDIVQIPNPKLSKSQIVQIPNWLETGSNLVQLSSAEDIVQILPQIKSSEIPPDWIHLQSLNGKNAFWWLYMIAYRPTSGRFCICWQIMIDNWF